MPAEYLCLFHCGCTRESVLTESQNASRLQVMDDVHALIFSQIQINLGLRLSLASYPRIGLSAQGNMSAITEGPVSFVEFNEESSDGPEVAILFVGVSLLLGIASRQLLRGTKVPYTVTLLLLGISLGSLGVLVSHLFPQFFMEHSALPIL
eukprot:Gb_26712 [translate_table: standard]